MQEHRAKVELAQPLVTVGERGEADRDVRVRKLRRARRRVLADKGDREEAARARHGARELHLRDLRRREQAVVDAAHLAHRVRQQVAQPVGAEVEHLNVPIGERRLEGLVGEAVLERVERGRVGDVDEALPAQPREQQRREDGAHRVLVKVEREERGVGLAQEHVCLDAAADHLAQPLEVRRLRGGVRGEVVGRRGGGGGGDAADAAAGRATAARGGEDDVDEIRGELPPRRRKVERVLVAERPVELRSERVEDDVDLVDDGDGAAPDGEDLARARRLGEERRAVDGRAALGRAPPPPPNDARRAAPPRRRPRPPNIPVKRRAATERRRLTGARPVSARWRSSSSLSVNALTAAGVVTITACSSTAVRLLRSSASLASERRSKANERTGLRSAGTLKAARRTESEKASSAVGTIWTTSCEPSARRRARSGEITVVLPSPMMSWWQIERPFRAQRTSLPTSPTCVGRRTIPALYSKTRRRGSRLRVAAAAAASSAAIAAASSSSVSESERDGTSSPAAAAAGDSAGDDVRDIGVTACEMTSKRERRRRAGDEPSSLARCDVSSRTLGCASGASPSARTVCAGRTCARRHESIVASWSESPPRAHRGAGCRSPSPRGRASTCAAGGGDGGAAANGASSRRASLSVRAT